MSARPWLRLYRHEGPRFRQLPLMARALHAEILKLTDENGAIPLAANRTPAAAICFALGADRHDRRVVGRLLPMLIEGGFIKILFSKKNEMLHITIEDNGVGRKASKQNKKSSAHKSMAMKITRDRIDNLNKKYKTQGSLQVRDYDEEAETGTKVLISLPYTVESNPINHNA